MESKVNGDNNTIVQINGISYSEAKEICKDIVTAELNNYKKEAQQIAIQRQQTLTNRFLDILNEKNVTDKQVLDELKNPDMQFCLREAQIAYMRHGTNELENVLSNILADRLVENDRTTLQIALSEAIKTAPLLLPEHLDILSLAFIFRYTKTLNIRNIKSFVYQFTPFIINLSKLLKGLDIHDLFYMISHIEYTKCGVKQLKSENIVEHISETYSGIFMKGFSSEEIKNLFANSEIPDIFIRHYQNSELMQINACDEDDLENILTSYSKETQEKIKQLFKANRLATNQVKELLIKAMPEFKDLLDIWEKGIDKLSLTSVGIILGRMNLKKFNKDDFDMKIWIK